MGDIMNPSPSSISPSATNSDSFEGPSRKHQKHNSVSHNAANSSSGSINMGSQSGPPYICPTCQTSYSRLEYLRRHERRHADIRPFVCDCGKGFSRSDVLSRHKRQCAVHLNGGVDEAGQAAGGSLKAAAVGANKKASARAKKAVSKTSRKGAFVATDQQQQQQQQQQQNLNGERVQDSIRRDFAPSPMNLLPGGTSFPFQQSSLQAPLAPPPLLPPAPYGSDMNNEFARASNVNTSSFGNMPQHLLALNNFANQQHNYPSSPESNGTISQHSSPRFAARDMSRHGSNGSRFSMRKSGNSFDQSNPRTTNANPNPASHYPQEFWEALDPAAKTASSLIGQEYVSGPPVSHSSFSIPPEVSAAVALANPTGATNNTGNNLTLNGGVTTPRGEPSRFSVPTGPLSPFSSIALTSSMSPYLSAFSNARDTPFVASPSRGAIPGTPGSNTNIFDWTMRPPSKPASSTNNTTKRDSISMQNSSSNNGATNVVSKRKRDEEESDKIDDALLHADADERSAAALLDSLRNAGNRPMQQTVAAAALNGESNDSPAQSSSGATTVSTVGTTPLSQQPPSDSFFEQRNATVGPEAFLLRLQGGAQEERTGSDTSSDLSLAMSYGIDIQGQHLFEGSAHSLSQFGNNQHLATPPISWESILYGPDTTMGDSNTATSVGWLMSPGVQQIINSFASAYPGDNGSYFSGGPPAVIVPPAAPLSLTQTPIQDSLDFSSLALEKAMADVKNPFYIPPSLFRACYQVHHWNLPPLTRLSMLALHSQQNLLKHFPLVHEPTFRLDTTPGCVAFTIAMLGCHQHGRMWWTGEEAIPRRKDMNINVKPEETSGNVFVPVTRYDEEDGQELVRPVVMTDKTDRLMRSFATHAKSAQDKFAILIALTLHQANNFISTDSSTRAIAAFNQTSLVILARKAGLFDPKEVHSGRKVTYTGEDVLRTTVYESKDLCFSMSYLPAILPSCSNDERIWRRWCELAARRRTAFLIFIMDTVASLDAGIDTQLSLDEVVHFPLPTPDTIWRAPTVEAWKKGLESYYGPSLDNALTEVLQSEQDGYTIGPASIFGRHGPFARLIVMMALVRGIVQLLEDRTRRLSRPSLLRLDQRSSSKIQDEAEVYKIALSRWREAWNQDTLCLAASAPTARERAVKMGLGDGNVAWLGSHYLFASKTASGGTPLSDDALPFYWFAVILLDYATMLQDEEAKRSPKSKIIRLAEKIKPAFDGEVKIEEEGAGNRGDLPNYRSLLRFAKAFVTSGENLDQ